MDKRLDFFCTEPGCDCPTHSPEAMCVRCLELAYGEEHEPLPRPTIEPRAKMWEG